MNDNHVYAINCTHHITRNMHSEVIPLDRQKGSYGVSKLYQHEDEIRRLLSHGVAKAAIARMYGSSWQTVHAGVRRKC